MANPYHKYVFDLDNRTFVGAFEEMYQQENLENFDSWFQDDLNHLTKRLSLSLLSQYNFGSILDFGCGKGTFTHLLKKVNNEVTGIDISETAVAKAQAKYPHLTFHAAKADYFKSAPSYDLIVAMEVLSYLENWDEVIGDMAKCGKYVLISLFIPPNPIGYVKSFDALESVVRRHFKIHTKLLANDDCLLLMAEAL